MSGARRPVVVSACLLGLACRYDGAAKPSPAVPAALAGRVALPVCPETAAGLGVPRPPFHVGPGEAAAVIAADRGLPDATGRDVAPRLLPACRRLVALAVAAGAVEAVLKERSPSCGVHATHGPAGLVAGPGVFAALLAREGLRLRSEEDIERAAGAERPLGGNR